MKKLIFTLFTFLTISYYAYSQFSLDVEMRPRLEFRDGFQKLQPENVTPSVFTTQRSRFSLSYNTENLRIRLSPQDVRVWGDERIANLSAKHGDEASLEMFEGFVEARVKNNTWISVGRQSLAYDNEWLLSGRNWNQQGNSISAFVLKAQPKNINLHLGLAWNANRERAHGNFYPSDRLKSLNFLWLNKRLSKQNQISAKYIASGVTQNDTSHVLYFRHTMGFFAEHRSERLFAASNAYYQTGVNNFGKPVSALLGFAEVRYIREKCFFGVSLSYLSGNSKVGTDLATDNLFDPIYMARHRYFGFMDYFRFFGNDTQQGGIINYAFTFDKKITNNISIRNIMHYFQLAQTNSLTGNDRNLGFENDLILRKRINAWGDLELGYCFFLPTETLRKVQNVPNNKFSQFVYLQFTVKSNVFNSAKK